MTMKHRSMHYFRSGLTILLGAGATFGSAFLVSRLREKQDVETRMDRLERMIDGLGTAKEEPEKKAPGKKAPAKKRAAKK